MREIDQKDVYIFWKRKGVFVRYIKKGDEKSRVNGDIMQLYATC